MNKFGDELKNALNDITTEKDLVNSAKQRTVSKPVSIFKRMPAMMITLAVILMCGVTVSAVSSGWLSDFFGINADYIEENMEQLSLDVRSVEYTKKDETVPYEFELVDVLSDGEMLLLNYRLTDNGTNNAYPDVNEIEHHYMHYESFVLDKEVAKSYSTMADFIRLDSNDSYCWLISTSEGINEGDELYLSFRCPQEKENGYEKRSEIASVKITLNDTVRKNIREIPVNKEIHINDVSNGYNMEKTLILDSMSVSAMKIILNCRIKDNSNNFTVFNHVTYIAKDGTEYSGFGGGSYNTVYDIVFDSDGCYPTKFEFLPYIQSIPAQDIVKIRIGDVIIDIQ